MVKLNVPKNGVSAFEAELMTEARQLAKSYIEAEKLNEEGNKLGYLLFEELVPEIQKIGLDKFNKALKSLGYKGDEVIWED